MSFGKPAGFRESITCLYSQTTGSKLVVNQRCKPGGSTPLFLSSRSFFAFVFSFSVWALPLVVVVDCPLPRYGAALPVGLADGFQPYLPQQTESLILSSIKRTNISIEKELATRVPKNVWECFLGFESVKNAFLVFVLLWKMVRLDRELLIIEKSKTLHLSYKYRQIPRFLYTMLRTCTLKDHTWLTGDLHVWWMHS